MNKRFVILTVLTVTAAWSEDVVIVQKDKQFSRTVVHVKEGDKLVFKNQDDVVHNLYSVSPGTKFGSYTQQPGQTTPVTVASEGEFEVQCAIHPKMKLTVKVDK